MNFLKISTLIGIIVVFLGKYFIDKYYYQPIADNAIQMARSISHKNVFLYNMLFKEDIVCTLNYGKELVLKADLIYDDYSDIDGNKWQFNMRDYNNMYFQNIGDKKAIDIKACCTKQEIDLNQCWFIEKDLKEYTHIQKLLFKGVMKKLTGETKIFREPNDIYSE